jgi:hypothetical protein
MADYTHRNLKEDVENASERFGLAPDMEARFARKPLGLEGADSATSSPQHSAGAHRHRETTVSAVAIAGSGA